MKGDCMLKNGINAITMKEFLGKVCHETTSIQGYVRMIPPCSGFLFGGMMKWKIHQRNCLTVLNMREIIRNLTWRSSKRKWSNAADGVI